MKKTRGVADSKRPGCLAAVLLGCIGLVLQSVSAFAAVETEPNDKLGMANPIVAGEGVTGAFTPPGDQDWHAITLATPGRLRCSVTSPPANIRAYITLYNRHADYLYVTSAAVNDGDDVYLTYDAPEPGTYFIRVHDQDNHSSDATYTFTADFTPVTDTHEPNDQLGRATLITGADLTGVIFERGDEDWYKIHADANDTLGFTVDPPARMRPYLVLYGPHTDYLYVTSQAVNPGDSVTLEHTVAESGFYYLRLTDIQNLGHTESYTLSARGGNPGFTPPVTPGAAEQEDNDRFGRANPIALDTEVSGKIDAAGDRDWRRMDIPAVGQLTVALTSVPENLALRFGLYNSSGGRLLSGQPTNTGGLFSIIYDVTLPGAYYLLVDDLDSNAFSTTPYTLSASWVEVKDPFEPNDNYGDAKRLEQINRINGYIFKTGDHDWFKITASLAGDLRIIASDLPENISPQIDLFNLSKEHLAGKGGVAGMDLELVYTLPAPGDYLIRFRDSGDNDESTQPYTLTIHGADFAAFAPTARIDRIDPGSIVVGDAIELAGSGVDSDGDIIAYSWRSSIDGDLSTAAAFSTDGLSMGAHTLYFKVQDNDGIWSTEVSKVVYVGTTVSDEVEDNGAIGLANEMAISRPEENKPVKAKINAAGDQDFFKVFINRPGRLTCSVTIVPDNLRLYLTYYGRHLNYLYITGSAAQGGDDVSLSMNVTEPGFIYLRVHDRDNAFNADFTYTLTAFFEEAADPQEPNDSILDAFTLTENTVSGYLFPDGDQDYFKVWVDEGATLTARVTDTPPNLRPCITLYGRNNEYLYSTSMSDNDGDDPPPLSYTFDNAGFVYVRVHDRDNDYNWSQRYRLTLTGANPGYSPEEPPATTETEDNNVIADADLIAPGSRVSGSIGAVGDRDWFKFNVSSPGIIHTRLESVPAGMRARMGIYRADRVHIDGRDATNPGDLLALDTRVTRPGFYMLLIEDIDASNSTEPYQFTVSVTAAVDTHEPNGNFGDATLLTGRNRTQATIFDRGDEDWYGVTCDAGSILQVTVADAPLEIRPQVDIYDNSGNWLAGKTATNNGQELTLAYTTGAAANHFFRVRHAGNNSFSTSPYTLIVNGAIFNSYTPLAVIDAVSPNPAGSDETVTLEGHGEDADGEIIGYSWRSSLDGVLSTSRVATLDHLTPGRHTLYFKVKDNDQNWSPETSAILYFGVPAPQEEEPNNEIGSATPMDLDTQYTGTIEPAGDNDFFRIPISQPGTLTISATNPTGSLMRTYLTMYTLNADYAYVTASANDAGDPVSLTWNIDEPGDYFLRVHDNNNTSGVHYTVTASLQMAPDPYEPNPDAAHATSMGIGDVIQGYIFPGGDQDWCKVTVDTPGTLSVSLTSMPENIRGYITIYDSNTNYTYVTAAANNPGDNVHLNYNITEPGPYFIRIHDRDNSFNPQSAYTLSTGFQAAPDPFEPNPDARRSTLLRQSPSTAYIFPGGDEDWYKFYAQTGSHLVMTVDETPGNLRPYLTLYNANMGYMHQTAYADVEGYSVTLSHTAGYTGYYHLRVHDRDNDWSSASPYRLSVDGADLAFQPTDQPVTAEIEPNNEFRLATPITTAGVTGTFGGDEDWHRFEVTHPSRLTLSLTSPSTILSVLHLYDANNSLRASRVAENAGDFSGFSFDIDEPGTWFVRIYADGNLVSPEPYTLGVALDSVLDPYEPNNQYAHAAPISFGESIEAFIFPRNDQDWFRLETDAPGMIRFNVDNVPQGLEISLAVHDQNNSQRFHKESLNQGTPLGDAFIATEPGAYYLRIYDRGNDGASVAPYTLTTTFTPLVDRFEPNDHFSRAVLLEEKNQASGFIYPQNDQDWYAVTVNQPGILKIQVAEAEGIEPHIELFTDSKGHLSTMAAKNRGDDLLLTYEITTPDRYYIRIRDHFENHHSLKPYVLTIQGGAFVDYYPVAGIDDFTPNPAMPGDPISLTGSGFDEDGTIVAYEWVSDQDGFLGASPVLILSSLSTGPHRISFRVQDNSGHWSGWVHKHLHITDRIIDEAEYNNNFATANPVPLSTWITGRIFPRYDEDFYKIYIEERGFITALVDATPQAMRAYITYYDAAGNYMHLTDAAANPGDWFAYGVFLEPGWRYVRVHDRDANPHERTYGLRFDFTPAKDVYEPNDDLGSATPLPANGSITDPRICRQYDEDWYRIRLEQVGRLSLSITQAPALMRGYITIYDANANYTYVTRNAYNDGEDVYLDYDVASPGDYYVRVHDTDNRAHTEPYTFTSRFTPVEDAYEFNDSAGHATLMPQAEVDAMIFPRGDVDWYKIYATQGETLSLAVLQPPSDMRAGITVYGRDINYTYTHRTANNSGDSVYLSYPVPEDGFYHLRIADNNNGSHLTPYRFAVQGGTVDYEPPFAPVALEQEPNNDFGQATDIALNTNVSGAIDPGHDYDWCRFYVNAPGILTLSHTEVPAEVRSEMWVYNSSYNQIGYRITTQAGNDNVLVMTVMEAGYYRVRLRDNTGVGSTSTYTLRVTHTPVVDGNEPNNDFGSATPLGQGVVQGYLFDENDEDWLRIYVRDAEVLSVSLNVVPAELRPRVILLDNKKSQKASYVNTNPGVGGENVIAYEAPEPGFYFVRVYDEDKGYSASPYTLSITGADFSPAPLLAPIGDRVIDETVAYAFTLHATDPDNPQDLVFSAANLPPGAWFDPATRTFGWTPDRGLRGTYPGIHFEVSDGVYTDSEDITLTVTALSQAPVLAPIGNQTVPAGSTLAFQISGFDPDAGDVLTFAAFSLPAGAEFTPGAATFAWTPTAQQVGTHQGIRFEVTDGTWTDFEYIDIEVTASIPEVSTDGVADISETGATAGGEVTSNGGSDVTERGVVFATHTEPTVLDRKIAAETAGNGTFRVVLEGLEPGALYYLKAYAANSNGVAYGEEKSFRTLTPSVAVIALAPSSHHFGGVEIGKESAVQVFTLSNTGTADLTIGSVFLSGHDADQFALRNDACSGETIAPSETRTIEVVFSPASSGQKRAFLSIPSDAPATPVLEPPLSGQGMVLKGDINADGVVDLQDAILALQVVTGVSPGAAIELGAEVIGDNRIGVQEVVYILIEITAGTRDGVSENP